jgi:hypothetical protein
MSERDAWTVLGLPPGAHTAEEVRAAYKARAREVHPDAGGERQEWDELREAYAMLSAGGLLEASDQPDNPGLVSRIWWGWRGWPKPTRLVVIGAGGAGTLGLLWGPFTGDGIPVGVSAALGVYFAGWWAWWVGQELRRPAIRPHRWQIVMDGPGLARVEQMPEKR